MNPRFGDDTGAKRKLHAARLLRLGLAPVQVAAMVGASRQTVYRWRAVLESEGTGTLRPLSRSGRPPRIGADELSHLKLALLEGPVAHGFGTPVWTLKRVQLFIERRFGVHFSEVHVWRLMGKIGLSRRRPEQRALECNANANQRRKNRTRLRPRGSSSAKAI
ncbi:MAG: transposase [Betaproteobacteria bacterium]|nr:transposase [Betaproteobacteria bacterium]